MAAPRSARAVHRIFAPDVDLACASWDGAGTVSVAFEATSEATGIGSLSKRLQASFAEDSPFRVTPTWQFTELRLLVAWRWIGSPDSLPP